MKKEEFIKRRGEEAYNKKLERNRKWQKDNPKKCKKEGLDWRANNPEKIIKQNIEKFRKCGKHYRKHLIYQGTGLQGERNKIRALHRYKWGMYKKIIAPNSELHHQWLLNTADYAGVALVEAIAHRHGIIDVIQIIEGKITLFREEDLQKGRDT